MEAEVHVGSIEHLDFEPEEEKAPEEPKHHWPHPIDSTKSWCGKKAFSKKCIFSWVNNNPQKGLSPQEVDCIDCLRLYIDKGPDWWWRVHRTYYQSSCSINNHNCGA